MLTTLYTPPAGLILPYAGSAIPSGWLECTGQAVSRTTYAALFAVTGTTFGTGDGSTTFNVPDLRGRTPIGVGTGSGLTARSLGSSGGAETHALAIGEMPSHSHSYALTDNSGSGSDTNPAKGNGNNPVVVGVSSTGSGTAHNNMQPWVALTFLIKV